MVGKLVETAFAGSADSLVMALLQGRGVSKEEAARIRALIDEAEKRADGMKQTLRRGRLRRTEVGSRRKQWTL